MTPQNIRLYTAIRIVWEDSAHIGGWHHAPVDADIGTITSIGWVVGIDNIAVAVSTSLSDEHGCISPVSIPWSCVKECKELAVETI
jgi:hypothetical protein